MTTASTSSVGVSSPNPPSFDQLLDLLQRQLQLYQKLDQMSQEQTALVSDGQTQALLELLSRRNRLVEEQTKVSSQLRPYRNQWDSLLAKVDPSIRAQIEQTVKESERLLAKILEQDNKDQQSLESTKQQTSGELGRVTHAGSAVRAYTTTPGRTTNQYTNHQG